MPYLFLVLAGETYAVSICSACKRNTLLNPILINLAGLRQLTVIYCNVTQLDTKLLHCWYCLRNIYFLESLLKDSKELTEDSKDTNEKLHSKTQKPIFSWLCTK